MGLEILEEKTKVAICTLVCITCLQILAWFYGYDGTVSQLIGVVYGSLLAYYFAVKVTPEQKE